MKVESITNNPQYYGNEEVDETTPLQPVLPQDESPVSQTRTGLGLAAIMVMEVFITFAQYILLQDLSAFCQDELSMGDDVAGAMVLIFGGVLYVVPAIAGGFADTLFGKYGCLVGMNIVRLIGEIILLILVAFPKDDIAKQRGVVEAVLYIALALVAISHGSYLAVAESFGADQLPVVNRLNIWSYFMWKKWCTSLGKTLCFYLMALIDKQMAGNVRLLKVSIRTASIGIGLLIILSGRKAFNIVKPEGAAVFRRLQQTISEKVSNILARSQTVRHKRSDSATRDIRDRTHELRRVALLSCLSATAGIYMTIHNQGSATYPIQGKRLSNQLGISSHSFNACTSLASIFLIPLLEIYNRCKGHWSTMHILVIAGFGYGFMTLSPLSAGIVETFTRTSWPTGSNSSSVIIWTQIPQYSFIGLADVFALIPMHEFSYYESPEHIISFTIGLLYSVGACVGMILFIVQAVEVAIPGQPGPGSHGLDSYEYLFYGLAIAAFMNLFILYIPISIVYRKRMQKHQQELEKTI